MHSVTQQGVPVSHLNPIKPSCFGSRAFFFVHYLPLHSFDSRAHNSSESDSVNVTDFPDPGVSLVIAARILRRRSPANFSSPSDIVFIPKRNNAREPTSEKKLIINSISSAFLPQRYYNNVTHPLR